MHSNTFVPGFVRASIFICSYLPIFLNCHSFHPAVQILIAEMVLDALVNWGNPCKWSSKASGLCHDCSSYCAGVSGSMWERPGSSPVLMIVVPRERTSIQCKGLCVCVLARVQRMRVGSDLIGFPFLLCIFGGFTQWPLCLGQCTPCVGKETISCSKRRTGRQKDGKKRFERLKEEGHTVLWNGKEETSGHILTVLKNRYKL